MHSLRRAALRSATSTSRAIGQKSRVTPFLSAIASPAGRTSSVVKAASIPVSRFFSQTARVASTTENGEPGEATLETSEDLGAALEGSSPAPTNDQRGITPYGIFVRNIVWDTTEAQLNKLFEECGTITQLNIARDARGLSRGYAFIHFSEPAAVEKAISQLDGSFWHGRRIGVTERQEPSKKRLGPREPTTSIYIGNIPYETTDAELNRLFRDLKNVHDVRVSVDRTTGWPRGFAHADFTDIESAKRAFEVLTNTTIGGRQLRIDYAINQKGGKSSGSVRRVSTGTSTEDAE